jgi:hypothetical protein
MRLDLGQAASPKQLHQPPSGDSADLPNPVSEACFCVAFKKIRARLEQQEEEMRILQYSKCEFSAGSKRETFAAKPTSAN